MRAELQQTVRNQSSLQGDPVHGGLGHPLQGNVQRVALNLACLLHQLTV